MEQPTDRDPEERHYTFEHYRRLIKAAHCGFLLKCAGYKHSVTHSRTHSLNTASFNVVRVRM